MPTLKETVAPTLMSSGMMHVYAGRYEKGLRRIECAISWRPGVTRLPLTRAAHAVSKFHVHGEKMNAEEANLLINELIKETRDSYPDHDQSTNDSLYNRFIRELLETI